MSYLSLSHIVRKLFSKTGEEQLLDETPSDYFCIVGNDTETDERHIVYGRGNKTFILDGNSVITMHYTFNGNPCSNILEPEDAEHVKKAIAQHYCGKNEPFPSGFEFLKPYAPEKQPKKKRPLFG